MQTLGIIFVIASFAWSSLTFANVPKRVKSLEEVPGVIKNKGGLDQYRYQMGGKPRPDGLGTKLPASLTAQEIVALLATVRNASSATLVGVKPWPYRENSYVAIACITNTQEEYERYKQYNQGQGCDYYDGGGSVFLGVIEYKSGDTKPTLIASYGEPINIKTNWRLTNLEGPDGGEENLLPTDYVRFDFSPFKISDSETAFGVRLGWNEGYAGGTGYFEALALFTIQGDQLVNVLSQPIYYYKDLAGEWNEDNTRNHEFYEGQNVLSMLPAKTNGYYDIRISSADKQWKKNFIWDNNSRKYVSASPNPKNRTVTITR